MKNKALAIKLMESDCKIQKLYIDADNNTCAIGCLALAAGVSRSTLLGVNRMSIGSHDVARIAARVMNKFGLEQRDMLAIQDLNDEIEKVTARRRKIIAYLEEL